jgi:glutathione S-transferase
MDFYFGRWSGNSARAAFGLYESGCAFRPRELDVRGDENRAASYLAVNPMGKIPALVEGSMALWESNAINWYIAEKTPRANLLPSSLEGRAGVQRWLFFQSAHVSPASVPVFRSINPRVQAFWHLKPGATPEAPRQELLRFLPVLESALEGRDWLEKEFSLADIAYAPHLWLLEDGGYDFAQWPRLRAWLHRLLARPAWKEVAEMIFTEI